MASFSRRRFILVSAATAGLAALPVGQRPARGAVEWRGTALGAPASIVLHGLPRDEARRLVRRALDEVARLEAVFSLYRADSALARLNAEGRLRRPPQELVVLLSYCRRLHRLTGGAFDPSVQPLWRVMAEHFARPGADPRGPGDRALAAAAAAVGFDRVEVSAAEIVLARQGMALTLNGVAQGHITDRVAEMLRAAGLGDVLVAMGEVRALGRAADGRAWRVGIAGRERVVEVENAAVATSSAQGTIFAPGFHHLFDPHTGRSAPPRTVTVTAPSATAADAASTALAVAAAASWKPILDATGARLV